ncbi:hypothetical protein [Tenacibaculum sp.]|uniref:hypothetical protein n=1 Tax=Tenacibaculum sp. TaxID=1906242 RepID=UPI003AA8E531
MLGLILINNVSIPIHYRKKLSILYRYYCGVFGGILFYVFFTFYKKDAFTGSFCFFYWGASLYSGGHIKKIIHGIINNKTIEKRNSWTYSYFFASLTIPFIFIISKRVDLVVFFLFAIAINLAYLGAKAVCSISKCCGIHKTLINKNNFKLQKREFFVTLVILLTAICFVFSNVFNQTLVASILLLFHGLLRWYAARYRFPYRSVWFFIKDFSVLYIILSALSPLIFLLVFR